MLRFKGADLKPVISEAMTNQCRLILVKDEGVYILSERGERRPDKRQKLIAYAVGCNPEVDPFDDWWALANEEFGGDDFGEFFEVQGCVFSRILETGDDLELVTTTSQFLLRTAPPAPADC